MTGYSTMACIQDAGRRAVFGIFWAVAAAKMVQRFVITDRGHPPLLRCWPERGHHRRLHAADSWSSGDDVDGTIHYAASRGRPAPWLRWYRNWERAQGSKVTIDKGTMYVLVLNRKVIVFT